jgi:hypothetical protein
MTDASIRSLEVESTDNIGRSVHSPSVGSIRGGGGDENNNNIPVPDASTTKSMKNLNHLLSLDQEHHYQQLI